jgi:predicted transcriptional regulator
MKPTTIKLSEDLQTKLDELRAVTGKSMNEIIGEALRAQWFPSPPVAVEIADGVAITSAAWPVFGSIPVARK